MSAGNKSAARYSPQLMVRGSHAVALVTTQQSSYEYGNNVENRSTIIHQPIFNVTPVQSSHGLAGDAVADDNASRFPIEIHIWANRVSN